MKIDHAKVKGLGGRVRAIGRDTQNQVARISPSLEQGVRGNTGFDAVAVLRHTLDGLAVRTTGLALAAQVTGAQVGIAADRHAANDGAHPGALPTLALTGGKH